MGDDEPVTKEWFYCHPWGECQRPIACAQLGKEGLSVHVEFELRRDGQCFAWLCQDYGDREIFRWPAVLKTRGDIKRLLSGLQIGMPLYWERYIPA